ncbi:MAG: oligosaccharide flippase family protein [Bacteroidetes bacterium]|nr:oligosaccharide flippase family protein [Bacteroidota bacterium]
MHQLFRNAKKFITNLAFLLFLNLLIKPFWLLGIDRTVQNVTGAVAYGEYYALFNFSFLFNILLDLGITNFNNRNISQNRHLLDKHLSGIILLRFFLAGIYLIISFVASFLLGYSIQQVELLLVLLLNQVLISFILYLRSNLAGLHLFKTDSIVSVLDRAIMIIICAFLLWGNVTSTPFRIEWFIWAQTFAYILTVIFTFTILAKKATFSKLNWHPLFALMILKKSYPFAILILLMTFYNRIDSVMIERLLPDGSLQAGIYAQAYRILDAANMMAFLFASLLLPMFSHMLKKKENIRSLLQLSYALIAVPAIVVASVSIFYRSEVMDLLYTQHVVESATLFGILMSCFFAISTTYIFGTLLTANGNLKQLNIMAGAGMAFNVILNFILIPNLQATGAAISSLLTQFITAFIQVILCYRIFQLVPDFKLIIKFVAFTGATLCITWLMSTVEIPWAISLSISVLASTTIALILRLISIKSIALILKN